MSRNVNPATFSLLLGLCPVPVSCTVPRQFLIQTREDRGRVNAVIQARRWRFALRNLILKDLRVRYRNMALGLLWSVINPLVMLGVLTFIFTYVYPSPGQRVFPVFVLLGLVVFNLFSRTVITATVSVQDNASLVKKVAFPRQLIPFSVILSQMIDGIIMILLLMSLVLLFRVPVTLSFLWLLVIYAVEFIFIVGVSMITSALNVYYRDMRYLVESGMTLLFWLTPVFYPLDLIRRNLPAFVYHAYLLNPLAGCVDASRRVVLEAMPPDPVIFGVAAGVAAMTAAVGVALFGALQKRFADFT